MLNLNDYSAVFFDFDGLLVNTEHLHFEAYRMMHETNHVEFPWDYPTFASIAHNSSSGLQKTITEHAPALVQEKGWDALYSEKKQHYQAILEKGSLEFMPGASEMLSRVKESGLPYCVVTNSTKEQVDLIKDNLPLLKEIPLWITREDYPNPKPAPDSYLTAIEKLQVEGSMIGFEDAMRGIRALQGAHITPVLICSPDHPQMEQAHAEGLNYFPTFHELLVE